MDASRDWAIRCQLEVQQHSAACWTTLTYDDKYLPPTLSKQHVSAFVKRLRKAETGNKIRFFAAGEYGETTTRPHYHVILFGTANKQAVTACWRYGHVRVDPLTPAAIAYVAGYCNKKATSWGERREERVDPDTGEVFTYQPQFRLMSRNPGLGAHARQYPQSWRKCAIFNGTPVPVPRYLHEAWRESASPEALAILAEERAQKSADAWQEALRSDDPANYAMQRLQAKAQIALAKHERQARKRKV